MTMRLLKCTTGSRILANNFMKNEISLKTLVVRSRPFAFGNFTNVRMLSTENPKEDLKKESSVTKYDFDEYDDYQEPKTAGQKVAFYGTVFMRLGLLVALVGCSLLTFRELFPGRMSPNGLFSAVFDYLQNNDKVKKMAGESLTAFGRDTGRNEGRRNHIDSYSYVAKDGSKRTRIRFNIKGDKAKVLVWAEVSDRMASNEYVYIVCQSTRTGKVVTIVDNRDSLEAEINNNVDTSESMLSKLFSTSVKN